MKKKLCVLAVTFIFVFAVFAGCASTETDGTLSATAPEGETATDTNDGTVGETASAGQSGQSADGLAFDNTAWQYNADDDVYWQTGVVYCATPATEEYESLGIYVPGEYMDAADNGDGTYTCEPGSGGSGTYTAGTAPVVMPVNTAGYSAQAAPTEYSSGVSSYTDEGFIYVYAGCRGRDNGYDESGNLIYSGGAPWGVTDLKAAVRYLRHNSDALPGDEERIFTFGHSGGGAQSSLMGATGDSELYTPYLESIGAAMTDAGGSAISDAIYGAMCWCPITSLDYADEAYEWNMGQYADSGTRADDTWTSALSGDLSEAFAAYINALGLEDSDGTVLTLEETGEGIYTAGTYYEYMLSQIELSLKHFLDDTQFPYTPSSSSQAGGGFPGGEMPDGAPSGQLPDGQMPADLPGGEMPGDAPSGELPDGQPQDMTGSQAGSVQSEDTAATTYETVQDYIDALNEDGQWVSYDADTNTVTITSVGAFVTHFKNASKNVGAFDDLDRGQAENALFGNDEYDALHFDFVMADLLEQGQEAYAAYADWDASYVEAYRQDLTYTDSLGNSSQYRQNMYNPMYYLTDYYDGYGTSTVAPYWRVHSGIEQGDTALTVEMNLMLALEQADGVQDVEFEMVWGQGHTTAERAGDSTTNFIAWVNLCCQ